MDLDSIREEYEGLLLRGESPKQTDLGLRRMARHIPGLLAELERFRRLCLCGDRFLPQDKGQTECSDECEARAKAIDAADRLGDEILHGDRRG